MDDLETLRRWEDFGAVWEVVHRSPGQVTLSLRRCDGGEEVSRLVSEEPRLLAFLDAREERSDPDPRRRDPGDAFGAAGSA